MRAVLDPNVLVSALLAPAGSPAKVLRAWVDGDYDLVVSPLLLLELGRALTYPKLRKRISERESAALIDLLSRQACVVEDSPVVPEPRSPDPGDDYLLPLARDAQSVLVSGDRHLLGLGRELPIRTPGQFLDMLDALN